MPVQLYVTSARNVFVLCCEQNSSQLSLYDSHEKNLKAVSILTKFQSTVLFQISEVQNADQNEKFSIFGNKFFSTKNHYFESEYFE